MSVGKTGSNELRIPATKLLPDGRKQLTRFLAIGNASELNDKTFLAPGTVDTGEITPETASFAGLRLVSQEVDKVRLPEGPRECRVLTFEQIHETAETQVGKLAIQRGDDGRITALDEAIQFSAANPTPQRVGATACPVWPVAQAVTGTAATDLIAQPQHGLLAGDAVKFSTLTGGAGLAPGTIYYVIAAGLTADAFQLSATLGGAAIDFTTDITAGTLVLDVVLILASEDARDDGTIRSIKRSYVNKGVISLRSRGITGGLLEVEMMSVLVRSNPVGRVVHVDTQKPNGIPVFTVTAFQLKDGSTVTDGCIAESKSGWLEFPYPGRMKVYKRTLPAGAGGIDLTFLDVFLSPPLQVKVIGVIQTIYTTSNQAGLLAYPLWNPTSWASLVASWVSWGNVPRGEIKTFPNYRVDGTGTDVEDTVNGGSDGLTASCLGDRVYANTTAKVSLVGGPVNPCGKTWTLVEKIDEVFIAEDGTQWYRKEVGFAGIPAQPAVPADSTAVLPTTIASASQLALISTSGVTIGTVTNSFTVSWTQGMATFYRLVMATLVSDATGTHGTTTIPLWVTPGDYATNHLYWVLSPV